MRKLRYGLIILVVLILGGLLWFFKPAPPSDLKNTLYGSSYLTGTIKIRHLWDRPFISIISSIPGGDTSMQRIPLFMRPLLPPTVDLYLLNSREGRGWAVAIDLGWRSRPFKLIKGVIMEQIQYRGIGAIEGRSIIRTPSGVRLLIYQDAGTLFLAEGETVIRKILGPAPMRMPDSGNRPREGLTPQIKDERNIAYVSFSNKDMELARVIKDAEEDIGFLILPSAESLRDGSIKVRYTSGNTIVAEISAEVVEGGDIEGMTNDMDYLLDLLDRFLSTKNLKADRTINRENSNIMAMVMIHPAGGRQ